MTWKVIEANNGHWASCGYCLHEIDWDIAKRLWDLCYVVMKSDGYVEDRYAWFDSSECRSHYLSEHKDIIVMRCNVNRVKEYTIEDMIFVVHLEK